MVLLIAKKIIRSFLESNAHIVVDLYQGKFYKYVHFLIIYILYITINIKLIVFQAGDDHHFHPTCARCAKCGDPFGDGEEMYLQGNNNRYYILYNNNKYYQ